MVPRVLLSPPPPPASLFKEYFVSAVLGIKDRALYITGMRFTAKPHPQEGLRSIFICTDFNQIQSVQILLWLGSVFEKGAHCKPDWPGAS